MRNFLAVFLLFFGGVNGFCEYRTTKRVNSDKLTQELIASNFNLAFMVTRRGETTIYWGSGGEMKDPSSLIEAHHYEDPFRKRAQGRAEMRVLAMKWIGGTITSAEKDQLLKMTVLRYLGLEE